MRILLVDDDEGLLVARARLLKRLCPDWDLFTATSGENALRFLGQEAVDVVITDVLMPGMSGTELLRVVKERHPGIVRMTHSGVLEQQTLVRKAKWSELDLVKPSSAEQVREAVLRAVRQRASP